MMNILIADDDILTRNQMITYLNSAVDQYRIAGQAEDGQQAVNLLASDLCVDIIILDMEMPNLNGISVAKYIYENHLPVSILALSNYDNIEYVKPILKYGAFDYLLKHELTKEIFLKNLEEITKYKQQLSIQKQHDTYISQLSNQQLLKYLILNTPLPKNYKEYILQQGIFGKTTNALICMQITNYLLVYQNSMESNRHSIIDSVINLFTTIFSSVQNGSISHIADGEFVIIYNFSSEISQARISEMTYQYILLIKTNLQKFFGIQVLYEYNFIYNDISNLRAYYLEAHKKLQKKPFSLPDDITETADDSIAFDISLEKRLLDAIFNLDKLTATAVLEEIFKDKRAICSSLNQMQKTVIRLYQIINQFFDKYIHINPELSKYHEDPKATSNIFNITDLQNHIINYYRNVMKCIEDSSIAQYSPLIKKALKYIHDNYAHDISLTTAAEYCNVSVVYLSKLFKAKVSTSFINYLNSYRVNIAKDLLKNSDKSIKEVAGLTGFNNYNYFIKVFKDLSGENPTQYKKGSSPPR